MVNIIGKLPFYAVFVFLLLHGVFVFAVAVGKRLLQSRIQPHYMVRDVTQLIMWEGVGIINSLAALRLACELVEPRHVAAQVARGEVAQCTHRRRDEESYP